MSYDKKFRERVLAHVEAGKTQEETRQMFGIGEHTISQWKKLREETGGLENRPLNRSGKKIDIEKLRADVEKNPEDFNWQRAQRFGCTGEAIRQAMKRGKITRKKRQ